MHGTMYVCKFMKIQSTTCEQHSGQVAFAHRIISSYRYVLTFPTHKILLLLV